MEPTVVRKESLHKNMKNLIFLVFTILQACRQPPKTIFFFIYLGCFFGTCFEASKKSQKNVSRPPIWSFWRPNALQSGPREVPKGGQNPSKIVTKSSPSRHGHPPAPFEAKKWSLRGVPPQKNTENLKKTEHPTGRGQQKT